MRMDADSTGHAARAAWGAQGILLLTHATPAMAGNDLTEGYLTQPNLMGHAVLLGGHLGLVGTLNLEGLTLRRGELDAGAWGEGYVDRRHPHTYLHEVMASWTERVGPVAASLSGGKGFAAFGTDDPMTRPLVKYPTNHHLAQILERAVLIGGLRWGPAMLEGTLFDGDEPQSPTDLPDWNRFGDSWAWRLTLMPLRSLSVEASQALVASPEDVSGGGLDQDKWSAAARFERADAPLSPYVMVEWARTREGHAGHWGYAFASVLGEAAIRPGPLELAARYERSDRPEEERLLDPFRNPRPASDFSLVGRSRWNVWTAHAGVDALRGTLLGAAPFAAAPFVEASYARVRSLEPGGFFDPERLYGADALWSLSVGLRLTAGMPHRRMGRYGVAAEPMH